MGYPPDEGACSLRGDHASARAPPPHMRCPPPARPPGSWTTRVSWLLLQLHRHALHAEDLRLPHVGHGLVRRAAHPHGGEAAHADVADRRDDGRAVGTPLTHHGLGAIAVVERLV